MTDALQLAEKFNFRPEMLAFNVGLPTLSKPEIRASKSENASSNSLRASATSVSASVNVHGIVMVSWIMRMMLPPELKTNG